MRRTRRAVAAAVLLAAAARAQTGAVPIKAFCIDFNWGEGGVAGFARPGLWADAAPEAHVAWYAALGCNVIQTFAVSCNGYAWYRGGRVPPQPGLKHDFLPEVARLGHARGLRVMGYFCVGANVRWSQAHPDLSYGVGGQTIPLTDAYLDYLGAAVAEALTLGGIDGFMVDWLFNPPDGARQKAAGGAWLPCDRELFAQLLDKPFPATGAPTADDRQAYESRAIERCWRRIHDTARRVKPDCTIWLSNHDPLRSPGLVGTSVLKEVDWMMDEAGRPEVLRTLAPRLGAHTRQLLCLVGWGDRHDARKVLADTAAAGYGIYGFAKPGPDSLPRPVAEYRGRPPEAFQGNDRNIAVLARFFNGVPFDAVAPPPATARPSAAQYAWHEQERIQFVCLDPCTWQGREYDNHTTPLADMTLPRLDVDQWLDAAEAWGAREILLVCKHTGGFCWWPTETTDYSVKGIAWQGGRGNLVKDVADACRRRGLAMGVYLYPDDPRFAKGMGRSGKTDDPAKQEEWNRLFRRQWEEVLTICGADLVREVWLDGGCTIPLGDILRRLAPNAVVFQGREATIRWVGNEAGTVRDPNWNTLPRAVLASGTATQDHSDPYGDAWAPVECDTTFYDHNWFWAPGNERKRKSLDHLLGLYVQSAGRGAVLLLNATPNTDGLIPEGDMARYREFGEAIAHNFGRPLGAVSNVAGTLAELDLGGPRRITCSDLWEDYRLGHRIRAYMVEGRVGGEWVALARGTAVGRRKLDLFAPAVADRVRVRVTAAAGDPAIRRFAVHAADDALAQAHLPPPSQGQPATASSCYSQDYAAPLLVDGDPRTRWNASEADPEPWVELDLGRPRKIARAEAQELADRITRFRIEARARTNDAWRAVHEGGRMGARWSADFDRVTARYVRLHILSSTNRPAAPTLWEFRVLDRTGAWEAAGGWTGAEAEADLTAAVTEPGEYAVQFVDAAGRPVVCRAATLWLDGAEAPAALRGAGTDTLVVTRSQVVTAEATVRLRAALQAEPAARGTIRVRQSPPR